ncbi:ABC transporter-like protein [Kalmanozyma brasiliensis GHG001]|uniref:ABC transporter domain-containing protein n=1 Tax=Kalmanozyma brasiliensis (strain GHG001) TaxID=1365824 RepID=V5EJ64_KALBG|nr:ABC transporter-like protein [Kalmanozyma brasiliensis GHG001]EST04765.1 ABC transporter-like protein [Kalmanozyma brasiliensis GHG001]
MTSNIDRYLSIIPKAVVDTTKALKTYPKLEAVLQGYASSSTEERSKEERRAELEKKLRPILTDAGVGKKAVLEIVEACLAVPTTASVPEVTAQSIASSSSNDATAPTSSGSTSKEKSERSRKSERTLKGAAARRASPSEEASAVLADLYLDNPDPKVRLITALSQESRFHLDCTDTASLDIDLSGVTLTLAGRDLLSDAHLRLKPGTHYGLVGRNGSGKSTLLTAIGEKLIPGLSRGMKILFVSQLTNARAAEEDPEATVIQVVVRSDTERRRASDECESLSKVLEEANEDKIRRVVLGLELERSKERLREARKLAVKWSGARGLGARKDLLVAESEFEAAQQALRSPPSSEQVDASHWSTLAGKMLLESQTVLDSVDATTTEARAQKILHGLGFSPDRILAPYSTLSGGWKSRACLASALLQPAHLLLLDEPVNYLDLPAVLFVQEFIATLPHTVVTVSHDREFLNAVSSSLVLLRHNKLQYFDGNLTDYERESRRERLFRQRQSEALDKKREKVQKSIESVARAAKKSGDDNKMRMVKSRQRKLDERWGVEVNAKGHRFKLNRDFGGYHLTSRGGVETEAEEERVRFSFQDPEGLRFPGNLVHAEGVSVKYKGAERDTIRGVGLTIGPGERVGVVGPNGHGKTTLLNAITGKISPSKGTVERHPRATIGIYAQHTLELLSSLTTTALAHFTEAFPSAPEAQARSFLGQLGLKGRTADTIPLTGLSGGQLVRLGLAEVMWNSPDLVILDEVTTHLDSDTIDALIDALQAYTGAVLLVSHDRYAVKRIIELAPDPAADDEEEEDRDDEDEVSDVKTAAREPGRTYLLQDGSLKLLDGGMDRYTNSVIRRLEAT